MIRDNKQRKEYRTELSEIKSILTHAKKHGEMPKGKAFLYSRYQNMGLIDLKDHKVKLTKKGKDTLKLF